MASDDVDQKQSGALIKRFEKQKYAEEFFNGEIRMRSLAYYKNCESKARKDSHEGALKVHLGKVVAFSVRKNPEGGKDEILPYPLPIEDVEGWIKLDVFNDVALCCLSDFDRVSRPIMRDGAKYSEIDGEYLEATSGFGDWAVCVNPDEIAKAIAKYAYKNKLKSYCGPITYGQRALDLRQAKDLYKKISLKLLYCKETEFAREAEYRFCICKNPPSPGGEEKLFKSEEQIIKIHTEPFTGGIINLRTGEIVATR